MVPRVNRNVCSDRCRPFSAEALETRILLSASYTVTQLGLNATAINASGEVVGQAENSAGRLDAYLWTPTGGLQDLGTLPGDNRSIAYGINAAGEVVGESASSGVSLHAFVWTAGGGMQDIGNLPDDTTSIAYGIDDTGTVVGVSINDAFFGHAFQWTSAGGMVGLSGTTGASFSEAFAGNGSGQIVGNSNARGTIYGQAAVFSGGAEQSLGTLPGDTYSTANAINAAGEVVGYANTRGISIERNFGPTNRDDQAFAWTLAGGMRKLVAPAGYNNPLDGYTSTANGINASGQVVGNERRLDDNGNLIQSSGVLWSSDGTAQLLPLVDATAINASGQIVGGDTLLTPVRLAGDANGDGVVNFADLLLLAQHYGQATGALPVDGDFNNDGAVSFDDLLILAQNYGRTSAAAAGPADAAELLLRKVSRGR